MEKGKVFVNLYSFRQMYDLYYEQLCKYLLFYTQDSETIEDIVQEVFLSLWENKDRIEIEHPKTYLFRMARNKILNHLRDQKNRSEIMETWFKEQLENQFSDGDKFDIEQLLGAIQKAIDVLPEKCKEIFLLSKVNSFTYQQIADFKQISRKTVETQMGIALKKIREYFAIHPSLSILLFIFLDFF